MFIIILSIYAILSVGGLTLFKLGAQQALSITLTGTAFSMRISWLSIAGLIMYICSFLIYMGLVSKIQLSFLTPISTGVIYILTLAVSLLVFHEVLTPFKLVGAFFVLAGIVLMNIK